MARLSRIEIAEKIKRRMEEFVKANEKTWSKNHPPFLKNELADLVVDLLADAWDAGFTEGSDPAYWNAPNPYREANRAQP